MVTLSLRVPVKGFSSIKTWMSDYDILANKTVPIIVTSVAIFCVYWRKFHAGNQIYWYKVNDATKGNYSRSDVKDRLSELPCEVANHILSYISIRDVTRMATVSRHWRNVCLGLHRLDLDWYVVTGMRSIGWHTPDCESYAQAYVKGVDKVLEMYRDQNILSFHLSCCLNAKMYGDDIDRWMSFVSANKGLHSLTLQFICHDNWRIHFDRKYNELYLVSGSFLSQFCYLKNLHLDACILRLENNFNLTNLTTLDLNNVFVERSQWQGVFSCSSTLKCLWLRWCRLPSKLCIDNNFPHLRFLMIGGCQDLQELEVGASKLERFDLHILEDLKCSFVNVPNLERVYLFPVAVSCVEDILNVLAAKVPSLIYLFIRGKHSLMDKLPLNTANMFYSVSSLRISMNIDDGNILTGLPRLLKSFPQLKKLEMKLPENPGYNYGTYELWALHAHTKLEYIVIYEFFVEYIAIAKYLLKSARVLKRMVVTKASKGLSGYENLRWYYSDERFSKKERVIIEETLKEVVSPTNVDLIVI